MANRYRRMISSEQIGQIRKVKHLAAGHYSDLDINKTIDFYQDRYVKQLAHFYDATSASTIADIGAGYGWLAFAFAFYTPARIIAVETDLDRAEAGRDITQIFGLEDRIEWRHDRLGQLELEDNVVDVTYCIEVLEHVYGDEKAVEDLARITRDTLILTTPNRNFPIIAHDTQLPFCHILPLGLRDRYARLFNRQGRENDNVFWTAGKVNAILGDFEIKSRFLHYRSFSDFMETLPTYLPYGRGQMIGRPGKLKRIYYSLAARLGAKSQYILPNIAAVYKKRARPDSLAE